MLLLHQLPSERLSVDLLFSSEEDMQSDYHLMIMHSIRKASVKYPDKTPVIIKRHDQVIHTMTDRLFPNIKGDTVLYGERREE